MYYPYEEGVLTKLQKVEKEILQDFQQLCEKYKIRYFAIGGTLIGAIRHEGFIPWDDDIDLGMLREDFDKFLAIPEEEYNDKYVLCTPEKKNEYYSIIPKFIRKDSLFVTDLAVDSGVEEIGIFVEIFVFENVDASKKKRARQIRKVNWAKNVHAQAVSSHVVVYDKGIVGGLKRLVKTYISLMVRCRHLDSRQTNAAFLKLTNSPVETGYVAYFGDHTTEDFLSKKEDLFPLEEHSFEDITILVPRNYDELLHQAYGEYMQIPPEEDRWNQAPLKLRFPGEKDVIVRK